MSIEIVPKKTNSNKTTSCGRIEVKKGKNEMARFFFRDFLCLCRSSIMPYCILSYLFYAILLCFLHIRQLLDGSSVFYVILLGLLKSKKMVKIDSVRQYRQRQICWLPRVKILISGKRRVFSKSGFLTTCCAGHHFPDRYQEIEQHPGRRRCPPAPDCRLPDQQHNN